MISREDDASSRATRLETRGPLAGQAFATATLRGAHDTARAAESVYGALAAWLREHSLTVVHERVFGSRDVGPAVLAARRGALDRAGVESDGPVTYVAGHPAWSDCFAGVIVHTVQAGTDPDVLAVRDADGRCCGRRWRCGDLDWIVLQDLPTGTSGSARSDPVASARRAIEQAEVTLRGQGLQFAHVARTWFHLDDIISWYDRFNAVRGLQYDTYGLMPSGDGRALRLPASTGIGAGTHDGRPVTLDLLAVAARTPGVTVTQLSNPAQMNAFAYGSAFSRGALIRAPGLTLMELSGTASIDEAGRSLHPGDFDAQLDATFDRVERLLDDAGARFTDIGAATAYVKRPADLPRFWQNLDARGLSKWPLVCIVADICREELLFELEAELIWRC
jgi:enamine deaminase RidA (YjgF/YER057c/UK114 family)